MRRKPVGRHVQPAGQARGDHPPADGPLQTAQRAQQQQPPGPAVRDAPTRQEPQEPGEPDQPDEPAQEAVPPLPPIDRLELGQRHPVVLLLEFGGHLVGRERGVPVGLGHRRDRTHNRRPFGDRETAIGQPGRPADKHHDHDQSGQQPQPCGNPGPGHRPLGRLRGLRHFSGAAGLRDFLEYGSFGHAQAPVLRWAMYCSGPRAGKRRRAACVRLRPTSGRALPHGRRCACAPTRPTRPPKVPTSRCTTGWRRIRRPSTAGQ